MTHSLWNAECRSRRTRFLWHPCLYRNTLMWLGAAPHPPSLSWPLTTGESHQLTQRLAQHGYVSVFHHHTLSVLHYPCLGTPPFRISSNFRICTTVLIVMCLQTRWRFTWTICEKRLLDEYKQLGEDIESGGSLLRCGMILRGKRYKSQSKLCFVISSL